MRVAVFGAKAYDRDYLGRANAGRHELVFIDASLQGATAVLAKGCTAVCLFVNDRADAEAIRVLTDVGVRLIALRCAGFNNVDLAAARSCGIAVCRVPAYSPHAVAEHTFALILALLRKLPRACNRVREGNFALDGLLGSELAGKTLGIVGAGSIGAVVARIARGFGCDVLACDPVQRPELLGLISYHSLDSLLPRSDIVTLHCPLTDATRHCIGSAQFAQLRPGAVVINTSRGAVIDTRALIAALKKGHLGGVAIDVYEKEEALFFEDRSGTGIMDDQFARLLTFPNVLVTAHQGFFTLEALTGIAATTIANLTAFEVTGVSSFPLGGGTGITT